MGKEHVVFMKFYKSGFLFLYFFVFFSMGSKFPVYFLLFKSGNFIRAYVQIYVRTDVFRKKWIDDPKRRQQVHRWGWD
jgi:hypothetical protein